MENSVELRALEDEAGADRRPVQRRLPSKLSPQEVGILKRCEGEVKKFFSHAARAGQALNTIRSQRLYRAQFETFEDYCRARFGIRASRARQLIAFDDVNQDLEGSEIKPLNENQVRPLVALDRDTRRAVWAKVVERTDQPTEREVKAVIAEVVTAEASPEEVAREAADLIKLLEYMVNEARRMVQMVQGWNLAVGLETEQKEELRKQILKVRDSMKDVQMRLI